MIIWSIWKSKLKIWKWLVLLLISREEVSDFDDKDSISLLSINLSENL